MNEIPGTDEPSNYLHVRANHIFQKSFSQRNSESLDAEVLQQDIPELSHLQKRKLKEILAQFEKQRTDFALSVINQKLKESKLEKELENSFELHVLSTNFPMIETSSFFKSLDEEMNEMLVEKLLKENSQIK